MSLLHKHPTVEYKIEIDEKTITPVFKKGDPTSKIDQCPVSTLPNFSKTLKELIYLQLNNYIQNKFT